MTKNEFTAALREGLNSLSPKERAQTVDYYLEMIEERMEEGLSEEEAVAALEPVEVIAGKLCPGRSGPPKRRKAWLVCLLILGSPLWLSILLAVAATLFSIFVSVYAVVWSLVVSFWAVAVSLVGGGLAAVAAGPFQAAEQGVRGWYTMGAGLAMAGCGLLLIPCLASLSRWSGKFTRESLRWMFRKMRSRRYGA